MKKIFVPHLCYEVVRKEKNEIIENVIDKLESDYNLSVDEAIDDEDINATDIIKYLFDEDECPNNKDIKMMMFLHEVKKDIDLSENDEDIDTVIEQNFDSLDDFYGIDITKGLDYNELVEYVKDNIDKDEEPSSIMTDSLKLMDKVYNK